jgi:TetR/AcrR family fatty acid metabolism transcriptional regulator
MPKGFIEASPVERTAPEAAGLSAKQQSKRAAIVEAATGLFTNGGYETTTIAHIAKKAGVAVGTVYLYFKNKQEILYAVKYDFDAVFAHLMAGVGANDLPHLERLRVLIRTSFEICTENTERIQLLGLPPQVVGEMHEAKRVLKNPSVMMQGIEAWVKQGIAEGAFRPVDPYVAAVIGYGMVNACLEQCFNIDNGNNQQLYIDMLVDSISHWLFMPEFLEQS